MQGSPGPLLNGTEPSDSSCGYANVTHDVLGEHPGSIYIHDIV